MHDATDVNMLLTSIGIVDDHSTHSRVQEWKKRHHIVDMMPVEHLLFYLRLSSAALAHIDVIVCNADRISCDADVKEQSTAQS
jgi:hypothetical protein